VILPKCGDLYPTIKSAPVFTVYPDIFFNNPTLELSSMLFNEFDLHPDILDAIEDAGYSECTKVQAESLTHTLAGKDIFVQSQTGSGKTAAFLIPLIELIDRDDLRERALILSPTRELASQIEAEAKLLSTYIEMPMVTVTGGASYHRQERAIREGANIVIGTPGRIIDLSKKRTLNLRQFSYVVIDEADRMFDMGFLADIRTILYGLPRKSLRQTMLFSATLSTAVKRMASEFMSSPAEVTIESENVTVDTIDQKIYHLGTREKVSVLIGLLKKLTPVRTIVFTNTKRVCEELSARLQMNGFNADHLTGDLMQRQRQGRINAFKSGELAVLIATDVAARGIHIDNLDLVVNYDIPQYAENYVHRVGRTARVGNTGTAITLACEEYVEHLAAVEEFIKMKIPVAHPEPDLFAEDASAGKHIRRKKRGGSPTGRTQQGRNSGGSRRNQGGHKSNRSSGGKSRTSGKQGGAARRDSGKPNNRGGAAAKINGGTKGQSRNTASQPQSRNANAPVPQKDKTQKVPLRKPKKGLFSKVASVMKKAVKGRG